MHVLSLNSALEDASKCWHLADGSSLAVNSYPPSVSYQVISCVVRWSHGQAGVVVSRLIYPHQIDKYIDKQWKDTFSKLILCEGIMANTSVIWQHPAHTTD